MGKPIYRVIVDFEYRNKGRGKHIKSRIFRQIKRKEADINIEIKNIKIEGVYGETNY